MVKKMLAVLAMLVITTMTTSCMNPWILEQTQTLYTYLWESQDPYIFVSENTQEGYYKKSLSKMEINGEIVDVEVESTEIAGCAFSITKRSITDYKIIMSGDFKIVGDTLILYNIESYVGDQFGDEIVLKKVK